MPQLVDGPDEPVEQEVLWKQGHMVRVVPYKQVWIDQEDAQVCVVFGGRRGAGHYCY